MTASSWAATTHDSYGKLVLRKAASVVACKFDPTDIRVEKLGEGQLKTLLAGMSAVTFHTRNYAKKINHTYNSGSSPIPIAEYSVHTNDYFAP